MKITDKQAIEIYNKLCEKKLKHGVPYELALKSYGLQSWSHVKERVKRIRAGNSYEQLKKRRAK